MKVERTSYPGWNNHPCYFVESFQGWMDINTWCYLNEVEIFLLSSGSGGYTFQVRDNKEWFALKWD